MNRAAFEHITRAVASITDTKRVLWVGSQSLLGSIRTPPAALIRSQDGDVVALDEPARTELVDGAIGELSQFHNEFGYYAHGVSLRTATLAHGWRERLVEVCNENTGGATAMCIHPHDLAVSKLAAGRPKDIEFLRSGYALDSPDHNMLRDSKKSHVGLWESPSLTADRRGFDRWHGPVDVVEQHGPEFRNPFRNFDVDGF